MDLGGPPSTLSPPKPLRRLPDEAVQILQDWYQTNRGYPYPQGSVKVSLEEQTGLSRKQINNWLINRRRRDQERQPRASRGGAVSETQVADDDAASRTDREAPHALRSTRSVSSIVPLPSRIFNQPPRTNSESAYPPLRPRVVAAAFDPPMRGGATYQSTYAEEDEEYYTSFSSSYRSYPSQPSYTPEPSHGPSAAYPAYRLPPSSAYAGPSSSAGYYQSAPPPLLPSSSSNWLQGGTGSGYQPRSTYDQSPYRGGR